ncbi:acyl-CoA dehydrogenase [Mycobacterium sp. 852002-53434_SCH5985345]|uniref:acyl-CoA dehydrogenase family protein n=1 Tax=unclassified Mycobacterium TaxID=2642494 RepID=UPI0007FE760D|nr:MULTISPECIES: acyl-CoA dehydrogenase family protein [unclassified Mycobacterium]OBF58948.1 acyl-CoA dehydrogenase [Mycobacterium sp. 852002-53434_SCH5985345]OBF78338.1 acyl-CoA dehydrogenase [Mycobacterium sp. 852002-51613_SCH5001154]OBF97572.1 acyl-CoA dehydrogenase [Mycobacterium sp. 852014-52450_SCH5900713]
MTATMNPAASELNIELLEDIRAHAGALDRGEQQSRRSFPALGTAGLLRLGAPANAHGRLPDMAEVIRLISGECMSTGFSLWAHRMAVEYLLTAATPYSTVAARPLLAGTTLGVTGMASAFKEAAGCGSLELTATPVKGGYVVTGPIRWASNLYPDSTMVTAVRTDAGERLIVALPLNTPGVVVGDHFDLLAMGSTASSYLNLTGAYVPTEQVLSRDFEDFLQAVRPTFLVLQSAMCLGLTRTAVNQAKIGLGGVNSVFSAQVEHVAERLADAEATLADLAAAVGGDESPTKKELLSLRLDAAELSSASADLEIRTAGGKGYASRTSASRRYREAAFIPVQSPSEGQLRWELAACA